MAWARGETCRPTASVGSRAWERPGPAAREAAVLPGPAGDSMGVGALAGVVGGGDETLRARARPGGLHFHGGAPSFAPDALRDGGRRGQRPRLGIQDR